ncbi:hypothetical protein N181_31710 [Sinorhizobium fredii USDA 205]|nr:Polyhydroxyalkanoic acid synthase [Sinorhizobium fredii CCBAU 83666]KSV90142.1 hypothetical protein N181_31710 [Sinorhizobium fredii USDA 205]GLS09423.1 hypothetical protein GCM10007864_30530 [Sinorhizobium fredii]
MPRIPHISHPTPAVDDCLPLVAEKGWFFDAVVVDLNATVAQKEAQSVPVFGDIGQSFAKRGFASDAGTMAATSKVGSWWPDWVEWLAGHSAPKRVAPPVIGASKRGYPPAR